MSNKKRTNDKTKKSVEIDLGNITAQSTQAEPKFLGMTAGERAFVSMTLFVVVLVLGIGILAFTGRVQLPF
jgi:uncharacterized protein HemX